MGVWKQVDEVDKVVEEQEAAMQAGRKEGVMLVAVDRMEMVMYVWVQDMLKQVGKMKG